jgi:stage III sporulation protein AG
MKYRYALLILAVGLVLMMLPTGNHQKENVTQTVVTQEPELEQSLSLILSRIDGAGKVEVLLTPASGKETLYQTNENGDDSDTVIITDSSRNESGLIRQVNPPVYLGAIVLCQGGDRPSVRLAIVDAVSKVTGLGADRISVLKMK